MTSRVNTWTSPTKFSNIERHRRIWALSCFASDSDFKTRRELDFLFSTLDAIDLRTLCASIELKLNCLLDEEPRVCRTGHLSCRAGADNGRVLRFTFAFSMDLSFLSRCKLVCQLHPLVVGRDPGFRGVRYFSLLKRGCAIMDSRCCFLLDTLRWTADKGLLRVFFFLLIALVKLLFHTFVRRTCAALGGAAIVLKRTRFFWYCVYVNGTVGLQRLLFVV